MNKRMGTSEHTLIYNFWSHCRPVQFSHSKLFLHTSHDAWAHCHVETGERLHKENINIHIGFSEVLYDLLFFPSILYLHIGTCSNDDVGCHHQHCLTVSTRTKRQQWIFFFRSLDQMSVWPKISPHWNYHVVFYSVIVRSTSITATASSLFLSLNHVSLEEEQWWINPTD